MRRSLQRMEIEKLDIHGYSGAARRITGGTLPPNHSHMETLNSIFERKEIWTLIGILFGFLLNQITEWFRVVFRTRKLKKALFDELETNYFQLEHKKDTLNNIVSSLGENSIIPATSVASADAVFRTHIASVMTLLKPLERDVIQNVYSRLSILDRFLDQFEDKFKESLSDDVAADPWKAATTKCEEMSESCSVVQELILSVLESKPVDIYDRMSKVPVRSRRIVDLVRADDIRKQRSA